MLQGLSEADAEQFELRLLSDPEFGEEFDIMVDTIVDQYLDDELSPEERDHAEQYFFKSESRREKLKFAAALKKRKADLLRKRMRTRGWTPYFKAAAIAFIAIGVGAVTLNYFSGPSLTQGLTALHRAYRQERPLESRISGFDYARLADLRSGAAPKVDSTQKLLATEIILGKDSTNAGADVHHAIGQYFLSERRFDEAIERFQKSLTLDPNNARTQTDLGTAFLERGRLRFEQTNTGEENVDFAQSLVHLNKALQLDSNNLEALFNRALLYREMGLLPQSERDWRLYLEKDSSSKWAEEAREKLRVVEQQRVESSSNVDSPVQNFLDAHKRADDQAAWDVVRRQYSSAGNTIANTLLDAYLDLESKGERVAAETSLAALAYLGKLELQNAGDTFTVELVNFYKRSNPQQRQNLAHARAQMSQAYDLVLRSHVNDALTNYSQAKETFQATGNDPEATLASYRIGHCYWLKPDLKKSDEIFNELREVTERRKYQWLFNQSIYRTASIRLTYNDYTESIDYAKKALAQSEQMGDVVGTLNALIALGDQYRILNDQKQSWPYFRRAVEMARDKGAEPLQRWGVLMGISFNLNALELDEAALEYQQDALRLALDLKPERPLIISRSYDFLALTYARLENYGAALATVDLAFESGRRLEEDSGKEMMAVALLHGADILRESGKFDEALTSYDRSIALFEQLQYPYRAYPARKGRLLSYLAKGNDAAMEAELNSVLQIFDNYRANLKRESERNTFFNVEQSVYDLAIDFAWTRKNDPELAFKFSELSRGRSLLDARRKNLLDTEAGQNVERRLPSASDPMSVADIKDQTPEDAQLIQYAVLEEKLLIWIVREKEIISREKKISSRELGESVRRFAKAVGTLPGDPQPDFATDAQALHKLLIAPIESLLDQKKLTCIVPDKVLHYLPFGALISEKGNEYLIKKFRIQFAPSASIFLESLKDGGQTSEQVEERILSVGNPTLNPSDFPGLQPLPAARREAQTIAKLYSPSNSPLLDRNATELAVRNGLQKSNVAHFALHYVIDDRHSLYSRMVLTAPSKHKDEFDDGLLQIHEIYKMNLNHMRLVVLSACQTAIERQYGGEGAVSVARPFVASGVPLVVATLWPVDSSSSERLMTSFHRHRTEGKSTAEALQQTQIEMLNDSQQRLQHPHFWAAFTVIGRYAKF